MATNSTNSNNTDKPVSDKQLAFLSKLMAEKDISSLAEVQQNWLLTANFAALTMAQASRVIKGLIDLPKRSPEPEHSPEPGAIGSDIEPQALVTTYPPTAEVVSRPADPTNEVEAGYFFIVDPTDNKEKFFRVQKGKVGSRWENYKFLAVQASDVFYPIRDATHRERVFEEIAKDPVTAMNEYGIRLGRCGVCNRILTDRDSRLRGIGPICASRLSASPEDIDLLSQLGLV